MRSPVRWFCIILAVALLFAVGLGAWTYWLSNVLAQARQAEAIASAEARWVAVGAASREAELPLPVEGEAAWVLELPRLDVRTAIIAGVSDDDLRSGVGWVPSTALPGEVGNMVLTGHRYADGAPLARLNDLVAGDEIIVATSSTSYTYEVRVPASELTVDENDSWIMTPVPGQDRDPNEAVLTLTTQQDMVPTADRSVVFAVLADD